MRLFILFIIFIIHLTYISNAQISEGSIKKLKKIYNSGNYEKCLLKANALIHDGDKTSKDPSPYLYVAMCFYKLYTSHDPYIRVDYQDGLKQSITYATKFIKKDKNGEMYQKNIRFFNALKKEQLYVIKKEFIFEDYNKAVSAIKKYNILNKEDDFIMMYFMGICQVLSNNSQGVQTMNDAKNNINTQDEILKINNEFKYIIPIAIMKYSQDLINKEQIDDVFENINFSKKIFPNNKTIALQYLLIKKHTNIKYEE